MEKCLTCPKVALKKELCTKCNDNYYPMENDPLNLGKYINCYNFAPEGYYLNRNDSIYKKIDFICKDIIDIDEIMLHYENNCFKIIEYNKTSITFNITGIDSNKTGSCLYFNKSIYYGHYNCIDKPENTYYVINGNENTGIIKDCDISCKSCYGESTEGNTNCIECAENYFKTEHSNTNCLKANLIPNNYYLNIIDNIYYKCHPNCKSCNGSYNNITNDMNCNLCVNNSFFLDGDDKNNCYYKEMLIETKKYYLSNIDNKFHHCYHTCSSCQNYEPNETNHYCINCNKGYYFLENTTNCFSDKTIIKNYYLDKSTDLYIWKQCNEYCKACNLFANSDGDCVLTCPNGTYKNLLNYSCSEYCPDDYVIYKDMCIDKANEQNILISDFKYKILNNLNLYMDKNQVINGSNFIGMVLSSNNMDPNEQIKNGISAIDLGNCIQIIKDYHNISKNESLMILNIETKNMSNINNDKSFNLGKNTLLEIYDISGRELDLSICKEDIKVMKYIGDVKELDFQSAKSLSEQGIDVFNARDAFFNDICHPYNDPNGRDIILNDRRTDIYQNATFCQYGCSYLGMNYNLMVANCKCDSRLLQGKQKNETENDASKSVEIGFKEFAKSFISNLIDFNFEILRCYNLALNKKILIHNIGFFSLFAMLFLQFIFFIIYLIKKVNPIKFFMLIFNDIYKTNKTIKNSTNSNLAPPRKKIKKKKNYLDMNDESQKNKLNIKKYKKKKYIKKEFEDIYFQNINSKEQSNSDKRIIKRIKNNLANILKNKNNYQNNNNEIPMLNINNKDYKKGVNYNISSENDLIASQNKLRKPELKINKIRYKKNKLEQKKSKTYNLETIPEKIDNIKNKYKSKDNKKGVTRILNNDEDLQDLDYEAAIIYDKRNYIRMFWSFLIDSQIILGTFCTDNYLYLFVIKLSFFIFTFQISFFLNALFYTDDYVSDAYHNNGVLDFISGLPKSIYSFIATLITTNLLKMLSNNKSELTQVISNRRKYNNYLDIVDKILSKLRKKLVVYFILVFLLNIFFSYYATVFCAVYRNSQKYWFYGCLESFAMDSLISLIGCILLSFIRYISIRKHIKCCYVFSNIISTFV